MKVIEEGIAAAAKPGTDRQSLAFGSICVLPNGRWISGFRGAPLKAEMTGQQALISWSDDDGKTWSEPFSPFVPQTIDGRAGLFRAAALTSLGGNDVLAVLMWVDHSNPELPFFNEETEGLLDSRIFFARSSDNGESWSEPELFTDMPFDAPSPITGPVLVRPNGEWILQFETNKHYYDRETWNHDAIFVFSKDQGKTWPEHVISGGHPQHDVFYWDQRPSREPGENILALFWTFDRKNDDYLNIHARESADNGHTWSEIWDTGVAVQPAPPVHLPNGDIVMVYVERKGRPAIKARLSHDGGRTWPEETEILIREASSGLRHVEEGTMQEAWADMASYSLGLPDTALLPNGDVLVTYYDGPETDLTDIRWARLRPEV